MMDSGILELRITDTKHRNVEQQLQDIAPQKCVHLGLGFPNGSGLVRPLEVARFHKMLAAFANVDSF